MDEPLLRDAHPKLHHYTSQDGLRGIFASRTLWATHYAYLNDSSEVSQLRGPLCARRARGPDVFPEATILRPSVLFGPDDKFLNTLARIARYVPVLPLFGRGHTKLQPVYLGDIAAAAVKALTQPVSQGKLYELGGPRVYSYRALIELVLGHTKRQRLVIPLPFPLWDALAAVASMLPNPPLTHAQVMLMKRDNVVAKSALSLPDLGVNPTVLEDILPSYSF